MQVVGQEEKHDEHQRTGNSPKTLSQQVGLLLDYLPLLALRVVDGGQLGSFTALIACECRVVELGNLTGHIEGRVLAAGIEVGTKLWDESGLDLLERVFVPTQIRIQCGIAVGSLGIASGSHQIVG